MQQHVLKININQRQIDNYQRFALVFLTCKMECNKLAGKVLRSFSLSQASLTELHLPVKFHQNLFDTSVSFSCQFVGSLVLKALMSHDQDEH